MLVRHMCEYHRFGPLNECIKVPLHEVHSIANVITFAILRYATSEAMSVKLYPGYSASVQHISDVTWTVLTLNLE